MISPQILIHHNEDFLAEVIEFIVIPYMPRNNIEHYLLMSSYQFGKCLILAGKGFFGKVFIAWYFLRHSHLALCGLCSISCCISSSFSQGGGGILIPPCIISPVMGGSILESPSGISLNFFLCSGVSFDLTSSLALIRERCIPVFTVSICFSFTSIAFMSTESLSRRSFILIWATCSSALFIIISFINLLLISFIASLCFSSSPRPIRCLHIGSSASGIPSIT